jgi:hypothetical protein
MNTDMEADPNQDLSALLDGELAPERSRFLLQRLGRDDEMRQRWARWQLMSTCLKGQPVQPLPADFAERVLAGLDVDSPLQSRPIRLRSSSTRRSLRWIGGIAIAASVGLAALLLRPTAPPQQPVAVAPQPPPQVAIQPIRIPLPEPRLELALNLPIPVHAGVVSTYRSPLRPVAIAAPQRTQAARFLPLPQPYAIDPELEAYLAKQKSSAGSGNRDVFSEHNVYLPTGNENAMGTVSWSPDDRR